jgi:tetratricopeptide (TPR) repeat protein
MKNLSEAYLILKQNVDTTGNVDRVWQEKSQFKLGSLLMQMRKYEEARIQLSECLKVHAGNANALLARVQLGECYRKLAEKEETKEKEIALLIQREMNEMRRQQLDETQRGFRKRRFELLREALTAYERLKDELRSRSREAPLNKLEEELLRRAWLGIGECHLDGEEYFEAKEAFRELQVTHRCTVEAFYAGLLICNMPDRIRNGKQAAAVRTEAKESLRLVAEDLKAMPVDHEAFRTPSWSRAQWLQWADDMQQKLQATPKDR